MNGRLLQLAGLKGIAASYHDIWGKACTASERTLRRLLVAMHVIDSEAAGADAIEAAITAHEDQLRQQLLPPVQVLFDDESGWHLPINLQAAASAPDRAALTWHIVAEDGSVSSGPAVPDRLELPAAQRPPTGYHTLSLRQGETVLARCTLIVAPRRTYQPHALQYPGRAWGAAAQLYAVRSRRNWGIGDYSDLAHLVELWGRAGAGVVGVNPLHAMFPHNPAHASPYSPSSRLFLNLQYLDVEAIADFADCAPARELVGRPAFQSRLAALREAELVDHVGVAEAKREALELLYAHFRREHLARGSERSADFDRFRQRRGKDLRRHALFDALQAHFHSRDGQVWGWPVWPEAFRDPASDAVAAFEREQVEAVEYYEYLQWQADLQLGAVGQRSWELGLGVGLYVDLAVSIDRAGAEAWSEQDLYALGASVGAPPDEYNPKGQNWGLPPLDPTRLRQASYAPFIATLRANMAHAGALRIDHVMALMRLFWIPPGDEASDGAYVHYAFDELLGIIALESQRNQCLVIGEDLGTVADEVRSKLGAAGVLSYRVLFFERDAAGAFKPPAAYPRQAIAVASTHDLATLAGWWEGRDLALRERLHLFPRPKLHEQQVLERAQDRERLLQALQREGLLPGDGHAGSAVPARFPTLDAALAQAMHRYLARSPAQLTVVQPEDVLLMADQVNLPGTTDQVPNWRRKLSLPLEDWPADERFTAMARALADEQGRGPAVPAPGAAPASPMTPSAPTTSPAVPAATTGASSSAPLAKSRDARAATPAQKALAGPPTEDSRPRARTRIVPRATYRMQLHRDFRFEQATALVPYLAALGVSHLYCSPILRARPGSRHGYDVVDHGALNPELGTRADFDRLIETLHAHGMGLLVDIVPNHMGVLGGDNAWWLDVLENGAASAYARFFDIDWASADPALTKRVLLPILGDQYGIVLERGELELGFDAALGRFTLSYFEHRLPIDPAAYGALLRRALRGLPAGSSGSAAVIERLAAGFDRLPAHDSNDAAERQRRQRDKTTLKAQLAAALREQPALGQAIDAVVTALNGRAGARASFDALHALIDAQPYRLAHWRIAGDEINYRRFFDVNELAALCMEHAEVFEATHRLILELAAAGAIDGLRIDHPDGLADPAAYFLRLQLRYAELAGLPAPAPATDELPPELPLYVAVEKIVAPHEQVPRDWAVHGTTGYRFANVINGLLIDGDAKTRLERAWHAFVRGEAEEFDELAWEGRHIVMDGALAGELTVLATSLWRLAREDRRTRDFTLNSLRHALAQVVSCFPVYRTYVVDKPSAQDRRFIDWAIGRARRRSLAADASVFDFLRRVLLGRALPGAPAGLRERYQAFSRRLQQYTSPVAAKGIEDTALYRHHRLISVNDVGGEPDSFGMSVAAFHAASRDRAQNWPHTMLATSTHDAKRSEDVRARIDAISEMPAAWRLTARRWSRMNRSHKRTVDGESAPSRNDEYLLYQTLIGSLPPGELDADALHAYADRVEAAMLKSARESKMVTSWINPNEAYEAALSSFIHALLTPRESNLFVDDLRGNSAVFAWYGALNGITMASLKFLSPGVPDLYQGCEAIEYLLVDPDNRRAVDYERRRRLLETSQAIAAQPIRAPALREMIEHATDGRAKFFATWATLRLRRQHAETMREADYLPLEVRGERADHVVAFARRQGSHWVVAVAARLYASMGLGVGELPVGAIWGDTSVAWPGAGSPAGEGNWPETLTDAISGRRHLPDLGELSVAQLLRDFPVAALGSAAGESASPSA